MRNAVTTRPDFADWVGVAEPRLRQSLTASFGYETGREVTVDALSLAWERWAEISVKDNPIGYVYGIGRNLARRRTRARRPVHLPVDPQRLPEVEPALPEAVASLPERQRVVVTLLYGYDWTMSEVAELLGTSKSTIQNHADRGLAALRNRLGVVR